MRLFIAVNFSPTIKDCLYDAAMQLKQTALKGSFTHHDNFHLTLVFIGETTKVNEIKTAMDSVQAHPFELILSGIGTFNRKDSAIYWMGVEQNKILTDIYIQLTSALKTSGFLLEDRAFSAHLTLGREVVMPKDFEQKAFSDSIKPMSATIDKISLMKSERLGGKLIYTEIYATKL